MGAGHLGPSAYSVNAVSVAEFSVAAIALSLKRAWRAMIGAQLDGQFPAGRECAGAYRSRVGLVSMGMIGRLVREQLRALDVEIWAYDPFLNGEQADALEVKSTPLESLFSALRCGKPACAVAKGNKGHDHGGVAGGDEAGRDVD